MVVHHLVFLSCLSAGLFSASKEMHHSWRSVCVSVHTWARPHVGPWDTTIVGSAWDAFLDLCDLDRCAFFPSFFFCLEYTSMRSHIYKGVHTAIYKKVRGLWWQKQDVWMEFICPGGISVHQKAEKKMPVWMNHCVFAPFKKKMKPLLLIMCCSCMLKNICYLLFNRGTKKGPRSKAVSSTMRIWIEFKDIRADWVFFVTVNNSDREYIRIISL